MTNLEKYKNEILNYSGNTPCEDFIEPTILKQLGCECDHISCGKCRLLQAVWLQEEYKEPEPDWSKVAVDTPMKVSSDGVLWRPAHFAKYEDGEPWVWSDGKTSFTTDGSVSSFAYAKLAEVEK